MHKKCYLSPYRWWLKVCIASTFNMLVSPMITYCCLWSVSIFSLVTSHIPFCVLNTRHAWSHDRSVHICNPCYSFHCQTPMQQSYLSCFLNESVTHYAVSLCKLLMCIRFFCFVHWPSLCVLWMVIPCCLAGCFSYFAHVVKPVSQDCCLWCGNCRTHAVLEKPYMC